MTGWCSWRVSMYGFRVDGDHL